MNERQVSEAVVDWAGDLCSIATRYAYPVAFQTGALPNVAAVVEQKRLVRSAEAVQEFPYIAALEQVTLYRMFDVAGSIMVGIDNDEADALAKFQQLQGYGAMLEASILADPTLDARVALVGPSIAFDYSPVFGETEDGVRGRLVVFALTVGEPAE